MLDEQRRKRTMQEKVRVEIAARAAVRPISHETMAIQKQVAFLRARLTSSYTRLEERPGLVERAQAVLQHIDGVVEAFDRQCADLDDKARASTRIADARRALLSAASGLRAGLRPDVSPN